MSERRTVPNPRGRAWIELDRAALRHNVEALGALLPTGCALMPTLKADAYGHGAVPIARELNKLGISAFCVAALSEGIELREGGVTGDILILGYTYPQEAHLLHRWQLTQTVMDPAYAEDLDAQGEKIQVQIKLDTGMHRLGIPYNRPEEAAAIFRCRNLTVAGAFTHLCADCTRSPEDQSRTLAQGRAFYGAVSWLRSRGCGVPKVHILSSYGLINYPELGGDWARVGIALYGVLSTEADQSRCAPDLRPVLSLKARVAQVRTLNPGERAGYDLQFTAHRTARIAVLSIGYGDGLPRSLSCGVGSVLLHGRRAPIAGRICMDQTLVDVTDIPAVSSGDTAVVIGKSGGLERTACGLAREAGTISNEILSRLGPRLERVMR